jgi:hypothetical protein
MGKDISFPGKPPAGSQEADGGAPRYGCPASVTALAGHPFGGPLAVALAT